MPTLYIAEAGHWYIRGSVPEDGGTRRPCTWKVTDQGNVFLQKQNLKPAHNGAKISIEMLMYLIRCNYVYTEGSGLGEKFISPTYTSESPVKTPTVETQNQSHISDKTEHSSSPSNGDQNKYKCQECGHTEDRISAIRKHIREAHFSNVKPKDSKEHEKLIEKSLN